jgi:hypothetical protein
MSFVVSKGMNNRSGLRDSTLAKDTARLVYLMLVCPKRCG